MFTFTPSWTYMYLWWNKPWKITLTNSINNPNTHARTHARTHTHTHQSFTPFNHLTWCTLVSVSWELQKHVTRMCVIHLQQCQEELVSTISQRLLVTRVVLLLDEQDCSKCAALYRPILVKSSPTCLELFPWRLSFLFFFLVVVVVWY